MKHLPGEDHGLVGGDHPLPDALHWVDPNTGTKPILTAAPAVIGGVVQ